MPEKFDPYYKWLGIAPKDQPANHYRLLGIDLFESDPDVIANAADQRMGHIRSFQTGKNSDLSQRVLNEIATARVCLLSLQRKAAYDHELRRQMEAAMPAATVAVEPLPLPELEVIPDSLAPVFGTLPIRRTKQRKARHAWLAVWAAGVAAVVVVAIMVRSGGDDFLGNVFNKKIAAVPPQLPQSATKPVTVSRPQPKGMEPTAIVAPILKKSEIASFSKAAPGRASSVTKPAVTEPPNDLPEEIVSMPPAPRKKAVIPDNDAQREALATARDAYQDIYKAGSANLAVRLLWKVNEENDPTVRYVLLRQAMDVAVRSLDTKTAFAAIDELTRTHEVNAMEMKVEVLEKSAEFIQSPRQRESIADQTLSVVEKALSVDDIAVAKRLGKWCCAVRSTGNTDLVKAVAAKNKVVDAADKLSEEVQAASTTLASEPTDPAANLTVGKYRCFIKGDWDGGLPMLVLGSDDELKTLAERDCEGKVSALGRSVALGDAWWKRSQREEDVTKQQIQGRAVYWYKEALRHVIGYDKDKVEKRIANYEAQFSDADHYWRKGGSTQAMPTSDRATPSAPAKPTASPQQPHLRVR